ncbi:MAG: protein jag [Oscillospiraceae bacterium]|jgi:spoIIIJ-associated protein|nr:protein jag [Oscillospiraceae bacterium]
MKSIEAAGKTEEEAIETGLRELGLARDDVSVEIIERGKAGFLGIGSTPATVRLVYDGEETRSERLDTFLTGLFEHMGVHASASVSETDTDVNAEITCEEQGVLVGKNGEVLDAIAHVSNYVVNRGRRHVRVNIDAEDYRRKRDEELTALARSTAGKVIKLRRSIRLDPMNAYERHVVHEALQDNDKVTTHSVGEEPRRRVVVHYGRGENN